MKIEATIDDIVRVLEMHGLVPMYPTDDVRRDLAELLLRHFRIYRITGDMRDTQHN